MALRRTLVSPSRHASLPARRDMPKSVLRQNIAAWAKRRRQPLLRFHPFCASTRPVPPTNPPHVLLPRPLLAAALLAARLHPQRFSALFPQRSPRVPTTEQIVPSSVCARHAPTTQEPASLRRSATGLCCCGNTAREALLFQTGAPEKQAVQATAIDALTNTRAVCYSRFILMPSAVIEDCSLVLNPIGRLHGQLCVFSNTSAPLCVFRRAAWLSVRRDCVSAALGVRQPLKALSSPAA